MSPARTVASVLGFVLLVGYGAAAVGQTIERPPRSVGGLFGGRRPPQAGTTQELTLTFDVLGGFDDNLSPEGRSLATDPLAPRESGYTGVAAGELRYWRGSATRYIDASGRAHVTTYSELFDEPLVGGEATVEAVSQGHGRWGFNGTAGLDYRPTFMLGTFGGIGEVVADLAPASDPTNGVSELRSLRTTATGTVDRQWSRRQRTTFGYDFSRQQFLDRDGLDSRLHGGRLSHSWEIVRNTSVRTSYAYSDQQMEEHTGGVRPLRAHSAELGLEYRRRISPTRTMVLSAAGGATRIRTEAALDETPFGYTAPSASLSARLDLVRTWSVSGDLRRNVTVLEGLSQQSFVTYAGALRVGGQFGERLGLAISAGLSKAEAPEGQSGSFENLNGMLQFDYTMTRWISLVASYAYYDHLLRGITGIPEGFPRRFERNSVRLGVSIGLPLFGSFAPPEEGRGQGTN